jgi:ABC-2 type transport system ATP-binding protein
MSESKTENKNENKLAIEIKGLTKVYDSGTVALNGVDLNIEKGDFHAILGANGAGKSTLISILTGIIKKSEGEVNILGKEYESHMSWCKTRIGVVPQEFNFAIFEKVEDILYTQAGYYGKSEGEVKERVEMVLKKLNLYDKRFEKAMTLSGGMKRRLMIARALIHDPEIFILDEPTAGVDIELRLSMYDFLKELNESGVTIILTTHYLEEAQKLCRNMTLIKKGNIIESGNISELLSKRNFAKLEDYYIELTK